MPPSTAKPSLKAFRETATAGPLAYEGSLEGVSRPRQISSWLPQQTSSPQLTTVWKMFHLPTAASSAFRVHLHSDAPYLVLPRFGTSQRTLFVENSGLGRMLGVGGIYWLTASSTALTDIITQPKLVSLSSTKERARMSASFMDQLTTPQEARSVWTEYVSATEGPPQLDVALRHALLGAVPDAGTVVGLLLAPCCCWCSLPAATLRAACVISFAAALRRRWSNGSGNRS
ncbi:hypothetical protein GWK47_034610 [Chionoecetes opilio]|uniref:Uncharacterized protein n=1 Tax=Chionoecetes opilio TaxID=41210 RepID=A0A8J5D0N1_CHIOP|nr:hypothetical protein GWK47_034610 [Chionoecetes opilio]